MCRSRWVTVPKLLSQVSHFLGFLWYRKWSLFLVSPYAGYEYMRVMKGMIDLLQSVLLRERFGTVRYWALKLSNVSRAVVFETRSCKWEVGPFKELKFCLSVVIQSLNSIVVSMDGVSDI
jgi:hypothetical protein